MFERSHWLWGGRGIGGRGATLEALGTGGWREVEGFKSNLEVTISRTL